MAAASELPGLSFLQAADIQTFIDELFPKAVCLAIQSIFFGIVFGVSISYFSQNNDGWKLRSFVALQMALSFTTLIISWQDFTRENFVASGTIGQVIDNIAGPSMTLDVPFENLFLNDPLFAPVVLLAGVNILLSQLFLAYHVYRLNKRRSGIICAVFIVIFSALGFALSVWVQFGSDIISVIVFHVLQELFIVLADLIATSFLFKYFRKIRDGYVENQDVQVLNRTYNLMSKFSILVINRGVLVTCTQFGFFGPTTLDQSSWIPLNSSLANVYIFTTLVILNTRPSIRGSTPDSQPTGLQSMAVVRPWKPGSQNFSIETTIQTQTTDLELQSMLREEDRQQ